MRELVLDLAADLDTVIARLEQIERLPEGNDLRAFVLDRVFTCDLPRLRGHRDALDAESAPPSEEDGATV